MMNDFDVICLPGKLHPEKPGNNVSKKGNHGQQVNRFEYKIVVHKQFFYNLLITSSLLSTPKLRKAPINTNILDAGVIVSFRYPL